MSSGFSAKRRSMASERIAISVLEEMGFKVIELNKKIVLDGVEVGEIDALVADQSGEHYAVEIKAGRIDVGGIRQAYVNATLVGAKPLVVAKGYADEAARELAERLGVKVVQLSDVFLVDSEELYLIMRDVIEEALIDYLEVFYSFNPNIKPEYLQLLEAIAGSSSIDEASERLSMDPASLARKIDDLRKAGVIPRWASKYNTVRRVAQLITHRYSVFKAHEESARILQMIKNIEAEFRALQTNISSLNQQIQRLSTEMSRLEKQLHGGSSGRAEEGETRESN